MADEADENLNSPNEDGTDPEQTEDVEETNVELESDDTAKLKEINKKLFERAKKAEGFTKNAEGRWIKKPKPEVVVKQAGSQSINPAANDPIEVAKMAAALTGLSDKELTELSAVAKIRNVSLAEAKSDPLFHAWQGQYLEEQKKQSAKLGASQGSGQTEPEPDVSSGMNRKDHMEAWKEAVGKK